MFKVDEASGECYSSAHILGQHGFWGKYCLRRNTFVEQERIWETFCFGRHSIRADKESLRAKIIAGEFSRGKYVLRDELSLLSNYSWANNLGEKSWPMKVILP